MENTYLWHAMSFLKTLVEFDIFQSDISHVRENGEVAWDYNRKKTACWHYSATSQENISLYLYKKNRLKRI